MKGIAFTIEYVKQYCLDKNIKVLSSQYKNRKTSLEVSCLVCNHYWLTNFSRLQSAKGCPKCSRNGLKIPFLVIKDTSRGFNKDVLKKLIPIIEKNVLNPNFLYKELNLKDIV